MAGPLSPRWVKRSFSRKRVLPCDAMTSVERPREVRASRALSWFADERNQRGAAGHDGEAELLGDAIAEIRRAHLRNGEAAGGDDYGVARG